MAPPVDNGPRVDTVGELRAGSDISCTLNLPNASGIYSVTWNFGEAATPSTAVQENVTGSFSSVTVRLDRAGIFTGSVTATQAGTGLIAGPLNFTIAVQPAPQIHAAAAFVAGNIVVTTDAADDSLSFRVEAPSAFYIGEAQKSIVGGGPGALIPVSATDALAGATGSLTVCVSGDTAQAETSVAVTIPPLTLKPDTLYAIPVQRQVRVGEPVTVLVATGATANPFLYMVGVRLTTDSDAEDVHGSLNFGGPGGAPPPADQYWQSRFFPDGIWAEFATQPGWDGFLLHPDGYDFAFSFYSTIEGGRRIWDMNLTPVGGQPRINASGALFNVAFSFDTPGTKTFGFQEAAGVPRTYYADRNQDYFWGDVTNDHAGISNSVEVLP